MSLSRSAFSIARRSLRHCSQSLRRQNRKWVRIREAKKDLGVGGLSKGPEYRAYRDQVRSYWRREFGRPVHPVWHIACARTIGVEDVRYVPRHEWFEEILPFLNDMPLRAAFRDKNLSDVFLDCPETPKTLLKRMHGRYYTGDNSPLSAADAEQRLTNGPQNLIIKPSQTDNGQAIACLVSKGQSLALDGHRLTLSELAGEYGADFIVQERVVQHPLMAAVHPPSLNTLRIVTLRWKDDLQVLLAYARFGTDGNLTDNAATGGLCCGIDAESRLNDCAIDKNGRAYRTHPTTGYDFAQRLPVPNVQRAYALALRLHAQIFHFDIVSWDIAIAADGEPLFIEVNFRGGVHFYQCACRQPLFGDLTEEILNAVRDRRSAS